MGFLSVDCDFQTYKTVTSHICPYVHVNKSSLTNKSSLLSALSSPFLLLTSKCDGRPCLANECLGLCHREISDKSCSRGGGVMREGAGTPRGATAAADLSAVCSVGVVRYGAAVAVIMIEYNGETWKHHGLRSPRTPTQTWTGRKTATAF